MTIEIEILDLERARREHARFDAVLSVLSPDTDPGFQHPRHTVLRSLDGVGVDAGHATRRPPDLACRVINCARVLAADARDLRLLIHCELGRARSPSAALAVLAALDGPGHEADSVARLRTLAPRADINPAFLLAADRALGRDGRLVATARADGLVP